MKEYYSVIEDLLLCNVLVSNAEKSLIKAAINTDEENEFKNENYDLFNNLRSINWRVEATLSNVCYGKQSVDMSETVKNYLVGIVAEYDKLKNSLNKYTSFYQYILNDFIELVEPSIEFLRIFNEENLDAAYKSYSTQLIWISDAVEKKVEDYKNSKEFSYELRQVFNSELLPVIHRILEKVKPTFFMADACNQLELEETKLRERCKELAEFAEGKEEYKNIGEFINLAKTYANCLHYIRRMVD